MQCSSQATSALVIDMHQEMNSSNSKYRSIQVLTCLGVVNDVAVSCNRGHKATHLTSITKGGVLALSQQFVDAPSALQHRHRDCASADAASMPISLSPRAFQPLSKREFPGEQGVLRHH